MCYNKDIQEKRKRFRDLWFYFSFAENFPVFSEVDRMAYFRYLRTVYEDQLTQTDQSVIKRLEENMQLIPKSTLSELAKQVYTSTTSLHRLVKKLGFNGYTEFKYIIEEYLEAEENNKFGKISENLYFKETIEDIQITYQLNEEKFSSIVSDMILHNDLYCFGTGWKQKQIVDNFANDLLYYGHSLKTLRNKDDLEIASKHLDENSMIFIVSLSGNMEGYEETMEYISSKGVVTVGVTIHSDNPLSNLVTHALHFLDSSLDLDNHHWSSIPLSFIFDQLSHEYAIYSKDQ